MALFQLTLFYPNLKQHQATLRRIRASVEKIAGNNWRVLSAGEQICAIGFETELAPDQIRKHIGSFDGIVQFQFLLVEVAAVHDGYFSTDVWQWLKRHQVVP